MEFLSRLRNVVALAYFVPAERLRRLVPAGFELERYGAQGQRALVATLGFCHDPWRPATLPFPKFRFHQVTFRVFVVRDGERGVYFLRTYVSDWRARALLALTPVARLGRFASRFDGEEILVRAESAGRVSEIRGLRSRERRAYFPLLGDRVQAVATVTQVLRGFLRVRGGWHLEQPVEHPLMDPDDIVLERVRLDEWTELGVLSAEEIQSPAVALFQPEIAFRFLFPRLA